MAPWVMDQYQTQIKNSTVYQSHMGSVGFLLSELEYSYNLPTAELLVSVETNSGKT